MTNGVDTVTTSEQRAPMAAPPVRAGGA
ncbi:MAG: hypothetical protein JWR63_1856, partial [Conexibacter sp.]|nr:hypothetical protein [Conexibacter sp.]